VADAINHYEELIQS